MTAQASDRLTIELPGFSVGDWRMFGVIRGEPTIENAGWGRDEPVVRFTPRKMPAISSGNWKGHRRFYLLDREGFRTACWCGNLPGGSTN